MTNRERGVFYIGSTSDPSARLDEHLSGRGSQHVRKYGLDKVVWFKAFPDKEGALIIEHRMKRWAREYKFNAIEESNPAWRDLREEWLNEAAAEMDF